MKNLNQTCEKCYIRSATHLSSIKSEDWHENWKWMFLCNNCFGTYEIPFDRLDEDWLDHLSQKTWFDEDSFFKRYRYAKKKLYPKQWKKENERTQRIQSKR